MADWKGGYHTDAWAVTVEKDIYGAPQQRHEPASVQEQQRLDLQKKRNLFFEEHARALVRESKYFEAAEQLEKVETNENDEFRINLLKAECYIHLGRETKAMRAMNIARGLLTEHNVNADLLISFGEAMESPESFLCPLIMYKVASDIIKKTASRPDEVVEGIAKCITKCQRLLADVHQGNSNDLEDILKRKGDNIAEQLQKALKPQNSNRLRVIILDFGVEYMKEMLKDLQAVDGADVEKKALKEAWSLTHIAFVLANEQEFDKSFKLRKKGTEVMDEAFGERARHHHVYGVLLHNMGVVLSNNGKFAQAREMYGKAIEAKEMAIDYSGAEKELDITTSRTSLDRMKRVSLFQS